VVHQLVDNLLTDAHKVLILALFNQLFELLQSVTSLGNSWNQHGVNIPVNLLGILEFIPLTRRDPFVDLEFITITFHEFLNLISLIDYLLMNGSIVNIGIDQKLHQSAPLIVL
jgi:hypothetical protein